MPANFKPLSFTTTVRNPERIKFFIKVLEKFEGEKLSNSLSTRILLELICEKIIRPDQGFRRHSNLKTKYFSNEKFSIDEAKKLLEATTPAKKQRGFDVGPPSRFETYFNTPKRLGLVFYQPPNVSEDKIIISDLGKKLANEATLEGIPDPHTVSNVSEIEQAIFAHCYSKYQRKNPYTAELNHNCPVGLLLKLITKLKEDPDKLTDAGLSVKEISIYAIWKDNNSEDLFKTVKDFRNKYGLNPSDEVLLDKVWEINGGVYNSYQKKSILKDLPDEIVRKMRITGLFTLRGGGRYLDINQNKMDMCQYIIKNYSDTQNFRLHDNEDIKKYYDYTSKIDDNFLDIKEIKEDTTELSQIDYWSKEFGWDVIKSELKILQNRGNSSHPILRIIPNPTRLEFLIALAIHIKCLQYEVKPNYKVDDQGLPTSTALGNMADIECYKENEIALTEVTLHTSGHQQSANEIPKVSRHVLDKRKQFPEKNPYCVYITPKMHQDALLMSKWMSEDHNDNVVILPHDIDIFLEKIETSGTLN